jgi:hypothetical protein
MFVRLTDTAGAIRKDRTPDVRLRRALHNRTSWRGFSPLFAPSFDIRVADNSAYRNRQVFMAITFVIFQGQRFLDAFASIAGKRLKRFVGGSK